MESREVYLVGDELSSIGFRLAGVKTYSISQQNPDEIFSELKDKKAILILTHTASQLLGEKAEKLKKSSLVIIIPEKQGEEYLSIRHLIKDTIGFDLRGY